MVVTRMNRTPPPLNIESDDQDIDCDDSVLAILVSNMVCSIPCMLCECMCDFAR